MLNHIYGPTLYVVRFLFASHVGVYSSHNVVIIIISFIDMYTHPSHSQIQIRMGSGNGTVKRGGIKCVATYHGVRYSTVTSLDVETLYTTADTIVYYYKLLQVIKYIWV